MKCWKAIQCGGVLLAVAGYWAVAQQGYTAAAVPQAAAASAALRSHARFAAAIEESRSVAQEIQQRGIPGMAVGVAVEGEIVWAEGFGRADLEHNVPATAATRFRIGSISKPLTAAALALLVEEGKLDVDAPVQQYVAGFPVKEKPISTRMLAGHLAGIRHYKGDEFLNAKACASVGEGLAIFAPDPLLHPPLTKYAYSSYGWNLISAVLEGAAKQEFLALMDERVFRRLGMSRTTADWNGRIIEGRTRFYSARQAAGGAAGGVVSNGPYVDNSCKWAGGGFLSTVEDLVRFASAHLGDGFLKPKTRELLFTSQHTADGAATGYGVGWQIGKDSAGRLTYSHGGGSIGGTSQLMLWPEQRVAVAVLSNLTSAPYRAADVYRIAEPYLKRSAQ